MNLLSRSSGRELLASQQTAEPHTARRMIRYTATTNTQQAIHRQFPGAFIAKFATAQTTTPMQSTQGDGNVPQTA
jgi:hypothetical protein